MNKKNEKLLNGLRLGKRGEIEDIYESCFNTISTLVQRNSGSQEDAEDIFQDALIVLVKNAQNPDFQLTANVCTYLYGIARNLWLKVLRKRKNLPEVTLNEELEHISVDASDDEQLIYYLKHSILIKQLNKLSPGCNKVMNLHLSGKTNTEIAKAMNYSGVNVAKQKVFKCKKKLKERVKSDPDFGSLNL